MQKILLSAIVLSLVILLSACSSTPQSQAPVETEANLSPSATTTTVASPITSTASGNESFLTPFASIPTTLDSQSVKEIQDLDKLLEDIDTKTYDSTQLDEL